MLQQDMQLQLAYWAGFIDGEGSITITSKPYDFLRISVYNTNKAVLDDLQEFFGCGSICKQTKQTGHNKAVWCWNTTTNQAYGVLVKLQPYLKMKQPQAELGIRYTQDRNRHEHGCKGLSVKERQYRDECYQEMIALNHSARRWPIEIKLKTP